ncbi:MAG: hypothetical protein AAB403_23000 [Planctomycetota bacterium]
MQLNEFISETLTQIARGIEQATKNLSDSNAVVSPSAIRSTGEAKQKHYGYWSPSMDPEGFERIVETIDFDVAVTATQETGTKGGIGVVAGVFALGSQGKTDTLRENVSRIQFRIPMVLPSATKVN